MFGKQLSRSARVVLPRERAVGWSHRRVKATLSPTAGPREWAGRRGSTVPRRRREPVVGVARLRAAPAASARHALGEAEVVALIVARILRVAHVRAGGSALAVVTAVCGLLGGLPPGRDPQRLDERGRPRHPPTTAARFRMSRRVLPVPARLRPTDRSDLLKSSGSQQGGQGTFRVVLYARGPGGAPTPGGDVRVAGAGTSAPYTGPAHA